MDDRHWHLLARHLSGQASEKERRELRLWIGSDPDREALMREMAAVWQHSMKQPPARDVDAAWIRLTERTSLSPTGGRMRRAARRPAVTAAFLLRAAVYAGLALFGVEVAARSAAPDMVDPAVLPALREFATPRGEQRRVVLSDGTHVLLAPESHLTFPASFPGPVREVRLTGTAFFDVPGDRGRPFRIRTGDVVTRVLGTRFTIRAWTGEEVRVAVEEGLVAVAPVARPDGVVLERSDLAVVSGGRVRAVRGGAGPGEIGWTTGVLTFRDAPVGRVLQDLGRWYDVDIRAPSSVTSRALTLAVEGETVPELLELLAAALDVETDVQGSMIRLVPRVREE